MDKTNDPNSSGPRPLSMAIESFVSSDDDPRTTAVGVGAGAGGSPSPAGISAGNGGGGSSGAESAAAKHPHGQYPRDDESTTTTDAGITNQFGRPQSQSLERTSPETDPHADARKDPVAALCGAERQFDKERADCSVDLENRWNLDFATDKRAKTDTQQTPKTTSSSPSTSTGTATTAGMTSTIPPAATPDPSTPDSDGVFNDMSMISPAFTPLSASQSSSQVDLTSVGAASNGKHYRPSHPPHPREQVERQLQDLPEVFCESRARIPTVSGTEIFLHVYRNSADTKEHLAIVFGEDIHSKSLFAPREGETEQDRMTRGAYYGRLYPGRSSSRLDDTNKTVPANSNASSSLKDVLVRIHSECYTGETAWSARCDCGEQLDEAARLMAQAGKGVIVYLRQEGRGIGLSEKLKAYNLQDLGADTVTANLMLRHPADARSFGVATAILLDLGLDHVRLLTNNPDKITAVEGKNKEVTVTERVPMIPLSWQNKGGFTSKEVNQYLRTKVERMGHLLNLSGV